VKLRIPDKLPLFSCGKSLMRNRTKRRATARGMRMMMKMTTKPTTATRSETAIDSSWFLASVR
jgi:hypothetical protein